MFPYDRNLFRTGDGLRDSLGRLDSLWWDIRQSGGAPGTQVVRSREAAAMVATARWMYRSGLQRTETRGMHKRLDYPEQDPNQKHYWLSGGLDQVWVKSSLGADKNIVMDKELALR